MGLFDKFPYTNFHELNLDWIIGKIKTVETSKDEAVASAAAAAQSATNASASEQQAADSQSAADASATAAAESAEGIEAAREQIYLNTQRLNNLIVDGQQTAGNTELLDIRVGYDGTIYDTAGNAVRDQVSDLNAAINQTSQALTALQNDINKLLYDFSEWEQGYISNTDGSIVTSNVRLSSKNLISSPYDISVAIANGYRFRVAQFSPDGTFIALSQFFTETSILSTGYKYRIEFAHVADARMNASDLPAISVTTTFANVTYLNEKVAEIDDIKSDIDAINSKIQSTTITTPLPEGTYSNVDECLLLNPIPFDGYITRLNRTGGSVSDGYAVVYEKNTGDRYYTEISATPISFVNNEATTHISVSAGQYIGVRGTGGSIAQYSATLTENPFVYLPLTVATVYDGNGSYGLSYTIVSDSIEDQINTVAGTLFKGKKILLLGDSRSSTDFMFYAQTLEEKTNASVTLAGWSGSSALSQATNTYFDRFNGEYDFVIWLTGGNDTGRIVGTFDPDYDGLETQPVVNETDISQDFNGSYFIQAVDHMQRKWKYLYYDWKTLNNGHKPTLIFCSDIPQKRNNAQDEYSNKEYYLNKNRAIKQCCEKNGVYYLDLYHICNFDMSYEPYYISSTDSTINNGLYYMDGLHPNQYGIDLITSAEIETMKNFIRINE